MKKIAVIFGTRPEAIKLCPVVLALRRNREFDCRVCVTGQHKEMLYQALDIFGVKADIDLALMRPNQSLASLTARAIAALDGYLEKEKPDVVMVQGDTTTVLAGALSAFYHHIPVAHVEAGLRTWDLESPWPEEANRQLTTRLAKWHFCPTENNKNNLLKEGVAEKDIYVTGNTVIDALLLAREKVEKLRGCEVERSCGLPGGVVDSVRRMVLVTGHRRENFGEGFEQICHAIAKCATEFSDVDFVYPVHLNPNVQEPVNRILGHLTGKNVHLIKPLDYFEFVSLMTRATFVLTDSGGVQEEAPSIGKPVLVMRDTTERPEAVEAGGVRLVGADAGKIYAGVRTLLTDGEAFDRMAKSRSPYGDGHAAERIAKIVSAR